MNRLHTLHVTPSLPQPIERLRELALDLHWTWDHDAIDLFRRLDQEVWRKVDHNPIRMLAEIPQERLEEAARDEAFLNHLERVWTTFQEYDKERSWYHARFSDQADMKVAYLSAEFGLHECVPMYSGGLGVLAGDHLKAASDLGVPLVGIGLLYQRGYFRQYLNADGWQQEHYPDYDLFHMPIELLRDDDGIPLNFRMQIGGREIVVHLWQVKVGRVNLYLLDTNVMENHAEDRLITETLYGGDSEMRIRQELLLGIGGIKALNLLGISATVFHMNEGHSAFLALERIRLVMEEKHLTFNEAREATRSAHVFTTHTPVPAGIDHFSQELMTKYFQDFWPQIGLDRQSFFALGGADAKDSNSPFNMAILAINLSAFVNGVSQLHGEVSRKMWSNLWPMVSESEVPINAVTNGVHARSWISPEIRHLFDRYLGPNWQENPQDRELWKRVRTISTEELWRTRERMRERLVVFARERLRMQMKRRGESHVNVERANEALGMETLTIGFARRFATYKRATILLQDTERLVRLLTNPEMPVQIIIAGKAHPKDEPGKKMIREIVHYARDERVRNSIVFLEDYDINVARHLVQGCDIWLNTPRPPMEASGTSGMKAAVNGVLNCSTLDGWWAEGYASDIGWTIGHGEVYEDTEYQDKVESELLYDLLEKDIVPLFYRRDRSRVAREWTEMMKRMIERTCPYFITTRMVNEYTQKAYVPNHEHSKRLAEKNFERVKDLGKWQERLRANWNQVSVVNVIANGKRSYHVGETVAVEAHVQLGDLTPSDVQVEIFIGQLKGDRTLSSAKGTPLSFQGDTEDGIARYQGELTLESSGQFGFAVRVLPSHEDQNHPLDLGLITWE